MPFSLDELHALRRRAFDELVARYPKDSTVSFIASMDKMIEERSGKVPPVSNGQPSTGVKRRTATGEEINAAVLEYQRETGNQFCTIADWTFELRNRGVAFPDSDQAAKAAVAFYVTRGKDLYEKDESRSKRDVSVWRIKQTAL